MIWPGVRTRCSGGLLHTCAGHSSDVFAVLFSPDGGRLYSGSRDQSVRVWDVASGRWLATLEGHGQYVTSLAMSPDQTRLAAGSWFGQIVLFDVATGDQIASIRAHDSAIRGVAFSPDGRWLGSASYDGTVRLHDSATREGADAARLESALADGAVDPTSLVQRLEGAGEDPSGRAWVRKEVLRRIAPTSGATGAGVPRQD